MKKIIYVLITLTIFGMAGDVRSLFAAGSKVFIKPFKVIRYREISHSLGPDIRDYIYEVFTGDERYILLSEREAEDKLKGSGSHGYLNLDQANLNYAKTLLGRLNADIIITGDIKYDGAQYIITSYIAKKSGGKVSGDTIEMKAPRVRYISPASHAIANYVIKNDKDFLTDYRVYVSKKEKGIKKIASDYLDDMSSVKKAASSKIACIANSSLFRFGYALPPVMDLNSVRIKDGNLDSYYQYKSSMFLDYFIYRSKNKLGDGVDVYVRGMIKKFENSSSAKKHIQDDMAQYDNSGNLDAYLGRYSAVPGGSMELDQVAFDLGLRFIKTEYFFHEAWSLYMIFAGRYHRVTEKYSGMEKEFSGKGIVWGGGLEVSLIRYAGVFVEGNMGYTPLGSNDVKIDGLQVYFGITIRTNHTDAPLLGIPYL